MAVGFSRDMWYNYIADRSHPPVASAVVEIPEYDPNHVYAWKPASNYKGWKLIDRGEAGVDDADIIQKAHDSLQERENMIVISDVTLDKTVIISKSKIKISFVGTISATGTAFQIGTDSTRVKYADININEMTGDGTGNGIHMYNVSTSKISFRHITNFDIGIHFDPATGQSAMENGLYGGRISSCRRGISFAAKTESMQGNIIIANIIECTEAGIYWEAGGNSQLTQFLGFVDCPDATYDLYDDVGQQFLLPYYVRNESTVKIGPGTIFITSTASTRLQVLKTPIGLGVESPSADVHVKGGHKQWTSWNWGAGLALEGVSGGRNSVLGLIDASGADIHWSIGNIAGEFWISKMPPLGDTTSPPQRALKIDTNKNVIPDYFAIPTAAPPNPVAGSIYFDTDTGTLYIYDGSAWKSVSLT